MSILKNLVNPVYNYPKQYKRPSWDPITIRPFAIAGEADSGAPALNSQSFVPLLKLNT